MYDLIGDIHGHATELHELLQRLGYREHQGVYSQTGRQVVFAGDFIDRGPRIAEVLTLVRDMVDSGNALAVMGNHELNAIAYHTPDPANAGEFVRRHTDRSNHQHAETLRQLTTHELSTAVEWFRSLPLWLDLGQLRIVHACWDGPSIERIQSSLNESGGLTDDFIIAAHRQESPLFDAVETVLKGKEARLPAGQFILDKDGHPRRFVRVKWYERPCTNTFGSYMFPPQAELDHLELPESLLTSAPAYPPEAPPVFFGHYWLRAPQPQLLAGNVACLDYSVARGGQLCGYRWNGEQQLSDENFVTVPARESHNCEEL